MIINLCYYNSTGAGAFTITDRKLYITVVTLSPQDNRKLLQQLKPGFKSKISWNKYKSEPKSYHARIEASFQRVNRRFVLSFENGRYRPLHTEYYLAKVEIKDYNGKVDDGNFLD